MVACSPPSCRSSRSRADLLACARVLLCPLGTSLARRIDQLEQDRVDVVNARFGLVRADDVVEWTEFAAKYVLSDSTLAMRAPAADDGAGGGVVDGHVARVGGDEDLLAGGRAGLGSVVDLEAQLKGF